MKHGLPSIWDTNPELLEQLHKLFGEGYSYAKIAEALGHGLSRSAVLSKSRRLGLKIVGQRRAPTIVKPSGTPAHSGKPRAVVQHKGVFSFRSGKVTAPSLPLFTHVYLLPLGTPGEFVESGLCKYIHGDPAILGWAMCAHPTGAKENSWCPYHRARVFDRKPQMQMEAAA